MKNILAILLALLLVSESYSQIPHGGYPKWTSGLKSASVYNVPETEINESIRRSFEDEEIIYGKKPVNAGVNHNLNINPENSGSWISLEDGTRVWRIEFYSRGALALSVFFDEFKLNTGAMVFLYDPGMKLVLGGFNHLNNKKTGSLPTAFVPGDRLVVELQVPEGRDYGKLNFGSITHGLVDITGMAGKKDQFYGEGGDCEVDINCVEGFEWQTVKRAVCRIIFKRSQFKTDLCTGALINTTMQDGRAYVYTANHCIKNFYEAETAVFYFGYEAKSCNGPDQDTAITFSRTIASCEVLATSDSLDFSLLKLSVNVPQSYNPYYAGWSISSTPPQSSATIHHPFGDVKKVSLDYDPATTVYQDVNPPVWLEVGSAPGAFWRIEQWDVGVTEGGSSGAPLFNENKHIVGNLTGGDAYCGYPYNDYFSKFHLDWDYYPQQERQLKYWLDSLGTGQTSLEGFDVSGLESIYSYMQSDKGYSWFTDLISGTRYEDILNNDGLYTFFAPADSSIGKLPEWYLELLINGPASLKENFIGQFLVIGSNTYEDLLTTPPERNFLDQDIEFRLDNEQLYLNDSILVLNADSSFSNGVLIPVEFLNTNEFPDKFVTWEVYPNPNTGDFFIHTKDIDLQDVRIRIFDSMGRLYADKYYLELPNTHFVCENLPAGAYFIEIRIANEVYRKLVLVIDP